MDITHWEAATLELPDVEGGPVLDGNAYYRDEYRNSEVRGLGGSSLNRSNSRRSRSEPADIPAVNNDAGPEEEEMFYDAFEELNFDEEDIDQILRLSAGVAGSLFEFNQGDTSFGSSSRRSHADRAAQYYETALPLTEQDAFERTVYMQKAIMLIEKRRDYEKGAFDELLRAANFSGRCRTCGHEGCPQYGERTRIQILTKSFVHNMYLLTRECPR